MRKSKVSRQGERDGGGGGQAGRLRIGLGVVSPELEEV